MRLASRVEWLRGAGFWTYKVLSCKPETRAIELLTSRGGPGVRGRSKLQRSAASIVPGRVSQSTQSLSSRIALESNVPRRALLRAFTGCAASPAVKRSWLQPFNTLETRAL